MYTTASALLDALGEAGVSHVFANFGSDHPALIEAIAEAHATGRPIPNIITCPNEMVGLSAAQGFWQASGVPQAVIVHVECGTQALAGAVHNAAKGHVPVLIIAGASPVTQHGELKGSRNEFIHWLQDVHDQRGLVRGYMNYDNEIRTGRNVKDLVYRALQFANSDPKGPAYLMCAREIMEEAAGPAAGGIAAWRPIDWPGCVHLPGATPYSSMRAFPITIRSSIISHRSGRARS
jgi:acetolactate synthase-1/2/3 large subunit